MAGDSPIVRAGAAIRAAYRLRANELVTFGVPEHRGHDDLLNAAALVTQAATHRRLRTAAGRRRDGLDSDR